MGKILTHGDLSNSVYYSLPSDFSNYLEKCVTNDNISIFNNGDSGIRYQFTGNTSDTKKAAVYKMFATATIPNKVSFHVNFIFGKNSSADGIIMGFEQSIYGYSDISNFDYLYGNYYFPFMSNYGPTNAQDYLRIYEGNILMLNSISVDNEHIATEFNQGITFGNVSEMGNENIFHEIGAAFIYPCWSWDSNVRFGSFWTEYVNINTPINLTGDLYLNNFSEPIDSTIIYTYQGQRVAKIDAYPFNMNLTYNNKTNKIKIENPWSQMIMGSTDFDYEINLDTDSNLTVTQSPQGYLIEGDLILPTISVLLDPYSKS